MDEDVQLASTGEIRQAQIVWDDSAMATSFANVVNLQTTREQVDLLFGTNRSWELSKGGPVTVALHNRIILTPHAAKRLSTALASVLREFELRYGALDIGV